MQDSECSPQHISLGYPPCFILFIALTLTPLPPSWSWILLTRSRRFSLTVWSMEKKLSHCCKHRLSAEKLSGSYVTFFTPRKKLLPKHWSYLVAALISAFGHHFDMSTHVANDQADVYVDQFKNAFGDIHYLQHWVILTRNEMLRRYRRRLHQQALA